MDTTISLFQSYLDRITVVRVRNIQDMAEAVTYGMADSQGRKEMSESWRERMEVADRQQEDRARGLFIVDGVRTGSRGLKFWLRSVAGWGQQIHDG